MGLVAPWHVGSSHTRDRTHVPCIGSQILNHCTNREVPVWLLLSLLFTVGFLSVCFHLFSSCAFFFFPPFITKPFGMWGIVSQARAWVWVSGVGVPSPGHWKTRQFLVPRDIKQWELSQRSSFQLQDLAPPNCLQALVLNAPCQTKSKTGTQTHPSADRLPKVILSPQTPQNTPPDMALLIRGVRTSFNHKNTDTSPSNQKAYTSHWTKLVHWGYTPEARGNKTLQPAEGRLQTH